VINMRSPIFNVFVGIAAGIGCTCAISQPVIDVNPTIIYRKAPWVTHHENSYEPITSTYSTTQSGIYRSSVVFMADQLERNIDATKKKLPTVVTSFSNLDNLSETSALGRMVGEHLMHELLVRGWAVSDVRIAKELTINRDGELAMSRELTRLRSVVAAENVVTGSYAITTDGVLLSVRVVDFATGLVVSSAETRLKIDPFVGRLIYKPREVPIIKISN